MPLSEIQSCTLEELNKLNPKETLILAASNRLTFDVRRQLIDQHKKDDHNKKYLNCQVLLPLKGGLRITFLICSLNSQICRLC